MIYFLLLAVLGLLLISAALAPIEALGWWAGWFDGEDRSLEDVRQRLIAADAATPDDLDAEHFVVFLSGIGAGITGDVLPSEVKWLDYLEQRLPTAVIIKDVFPYTVLDSRLSGGRIFSWIWRFVERMSHKNHRNALMWLVNFRNLFQVTVSADPRYGPVYNLGVAKMILIKLADRGYGLSSGVPVTLIGSSGGGQISIGTSTYLGKVLRGPLRIISLGGVFSGDIGMRYIDRLDHLYGARDKVPLLGKIFYVERWPMVWWSVWNKGVQQGKYHEREIGPMVHSGDYDYYDPNAFTEDGQSYFHLTAEAVLSVLADYGVKVAPPQEPRHAPQ